MSIIDELKLNEMLQFATKNYIPVVCTPTAQFLYDTIKQLKPNNILEIGTAIGYSGIIMLNANKQANLTTIEIEKSRAELAKKNFELYGLTSRVNLIVDDAKNVLHTLNQKYDFIFLDGPKGQYINYLPYLLKLLNTNGIIFCDNLNLHNLVNNPQVPRKKRTMVNNIKKFKEQISNSNELQTTFFEIGDGVAIIKKLN